MRFAFYDLGDQPEGTVAEVRLTGRAANVILVNELNFTRYRAGAPFSYTGGHYQRSPVSLEVPEAGHWYVVVDLGGFGGRVRGKVKVLPPGDQDLDAQDSHDLAEA
jgi:hypothetical protein